MIDAFASWILIINKMLFWVKDFDDLIYFFMILSIEL
jgi:hypothetical protein